jgi:hypothetical protein
MAPPTAVAIATRLGSYKSAVSRGHAPPNSFLESGATPVRLPGTPDPIVV